MNQSSGNQLCASVRDMFALERSLLSWRLQFWQLPKQAACFNLAAAASSTFLAAATAAEVFLSFHIGGQRQHHQLRCSSISIQRPRSNNSPFCYASNSNGAACSGGSASMGSSTVSDASRLSATSTAPFQQQEIQRQLLIFRGSIAGVACLVSFISSSTSSQQRLGDSLVSFSDSSCFRERDRTDQQQFRAWQLTLPPPLHRHQLTSRRRDLIVAVADVSALLRASSESCRGSSPCRRSCIDIS